MKGKRKVPFNEANKERLSGMHDLDAGEGARSGWRCNDCPKGNSTHGGHPHPPNHPSPCKATGFNKVACTCELDLPLRTGELQRRAHALTLALESVSCAVLALHRARMCTSGSKSHKAVLEAHKVVLDLGTTLSVEIDKLGTHQDFEAKLVLAREILDLEGDGSMWAIDFKAKALAKLVLK